MRIIFMKVMFTWIFFHLSILSKKGHVDNLETPFQNTCSVSNLSLFLWERNSFSPAGTTLIVLILSTLWQWTQSAGLCWPFSWMAHLEFVRLFKFQLFLKWSWVVDKVHYFKFLWCNFSVSFPIRCFDLFSKTPPTSETHHVIQT